MMLGLRIRPEYPTPLFSGLQQWIKIPDSNKVISSGGRVSLVLDKSGNNANATQDTVSAQPALVTASNGKSALSFDNDNNRFMLMNLPATSMTNVTVFAVVEQAVSAAQGHVFASSGANQSIRMSNNNQGFQSNDGTTALTLNPAPSILNTPAILALTCDAAGLSRSLYKNSKTAGTTGAYDGTLGTQFFGSVATAAGNARGGFNLIEFLIYNRVLATAENNAVFDYLSAENGIALS